MRWIVYYAEMELTDRKFQHILLFKPIEGARFAGGDHHMCLRKYSSFDRKANQSVHLDERTPKRTPKQSESVKLDKPDLS